MLFQSQYVTVKDWRMLGSITTQLYFTNDLLLRRLDPDEQTFIAPYFKFVEEQIALPWQRMCSAAAKHNLRSPEFVLVEQLLPAASEIAKVVFSKLLQQFPTHKSRQGRLTDPGITQSCVRDLNMFQAYLWLCVLQGKTEAIDKELVDLCVMILPRVEFKWQLIEAWNRVLTEEIYSRRSQQFGYRFLG